MADGNQRLEKAKTKNGGTGISPAPPQRKYTTFILLRFGLVDV
jgi:hypothetical protein